MGAVGVAERLAEKQREISVSEFFEQNKHVLGFDSPTRALLTSVKEAVDNALDACEEAGILPDVRVELERLDGEEYRLTVEDNGPGIVKRQVSKVFGKLLYGSRFHTWSQTRGQQGLGISGAILYGQLTTGRPAVITSKTEKDDVAYQVQLHIDTKTNKPHVVSQEYEVWERASGTRVEIHLRGRYVTGRQSVTEYLRGTAIVNPYARLTFRAPDTEETTFQRVSEALPPPPEEVQPHPYGVEIGHLLRMAKESSARKVSAFLQTEFSRISARVAKAICERADVPPERRPKFLKLEEAKRLLQAFRKVKIMAPPTDCLSPIGERLIRKGLRNVVGAHRPDFYCPPVTRSPSVYGGHPFQVEVGIVFGGDLPANQPVELLRYANRVPLLYQQGGCAATKAVEGVDWRRYGVEQRGGRGLPHGPMVVLVHVCSTKVPFTSEAKEAIAPIPEIVDEVTLALQECGRRLKSHMRKRAQRAKTQEKFEIVRAILPRLAQKSAAIVRRPVPDIAKTITRIMNVVWVDDDVTFEDGRHRVRLRFHNYTGARKRLTLHTLLPLEALDPESLDPKPSEIRPDGRVAWRLPPLAATESSLVAFELRGLEEEEFAEVEAYVSGIDPSRVVGADPLPGDWDLAVEALQDETLLPEPQVLGEVMEGD